LIWKQFTGLQIVPASALKAGKHSRYQNDFQLCFQAVYSIIQPVYNQQRQMIELKAV
jgi:hypothetical protein